MIVPLHNHSEYSQIDGLSTPKEIAKRVITDLGCPCCGLTDHGVVAGHLEFDKEIRAAGGKPIFGCELYHGTRIGEKMGNKRDQAHLIALAYTDEGLLNLWRLNDAAAQEPRFHHVGRNTWEDFEKYREGIFFTSACPAGLVAQGILKDDMSDLNRYLDTLGENFFIELSTYPGDQPFDDSDMDNPIFIRDLNIAKANIAQERGIRTVYGDDGHYAFPDQWSTHDAYVARRMAESIWTPIEDRSMYHPEGALCIKSEDDVRKALSYLPDSIVDEAIETSVWIGEQVDAHLPDTRRHLPIFIPDASPWVEKGKYADDEADLLFCDLVTEGLNRRYPDLPSQAVNQTVKEMEVFLDPEHGLYHYFLLGWDVMQFCDHAHEWLKDPDNFKALELEQADEIPILPIERGPGRGSSAGCILAYELEITDIDPLPYDLIFERFWNPGRAEGFPDIDSDFEKSKRYLVKRYLSWRWGHDRVRSIGTITRMKPKALVDHSLGMCRTFGMTWQEAEDLKNIIEKTPDLDILGVDQIGWSREVDPGKVIYIMDEVGDAIMSWLDEQRPERQEIIANFLEHAEQLCNRVSNYGVHASGIVISDAYLPDIAPCRFAGSPSQRIPVTQFAMGDIDKLMLIKFDALGLRTLDVLADWKAQMLKEHGIVIEWSGLEWEDHDDEMWELLDRKFTAGIFQVERGLPARLCEDLKPRSVSDLSIIGSLNRPGPINSGAPESFVLRSRGDEEIAYDDPFLEDLLDTTFGWFLYQEQVIRYFSKLGYNDSDADAVRKILGKKQPEKWAALHDGLGEWEGKSYVDMCAQAGVGKKNAEVIWKKLVDFGKYSFNKSHAIAYATIGFRAAFAKYNGTPEFYMACIRNVDKAKKAERVPAYINESRRWGIKVNGPDIERSDVDVGVFDGDIYFGFSDVNKVSREGSKYLVEIRNSGVDVSSPELLDGYKEAASDIWKKKNKELTKAGLPKQEGKSPAQRLNSGHITHLYTAGSWERLEGYPTPMRELQARELETLTVILSDNTAEAFAMHEEEVSACDSYFEAKMPYPGEDVRFTVPGVITNVRPTTVKKGKNVGQSMGIITIEYGGEVLEFAAFHDKWLSHKFLWNERTPGIFTIRHSLSQDGRPGYNFESGSKLA